MGLARPLVRRPHQRQHQHQHQCAARIPIIDTTIARAQSPTSGVVALALWVLRNQPEILSTDVPSAEIDSCTAVGFTLVYHDALVDHFSRQARLTRDVDSGITDGKSCWMPWASGLSSIRGALAGPSSGVVSEALAQGPWLVNNLVTRGPRYQASQTRMSRLMALAEQPHSTPAGFHVGCVLSGITQGHFASCLGLHALRCPLASYRKLPGDKTFI